MRAKIIRSALLGYQMISTERQAPHGFIWLCTLDVQDFRCVVVLRALMLYAFVDIGSYTLRQKQVGCVVPELYSHFICTTTLLKQSDVTLEKSRDVYDI